MSKSIDGIKPPATTQFEAWRRWLNWTQTRLLQLGGKRIKIS